VRPVVGPPPEAPLEVKPSMKPPVLVMLPPPRQELPVVPNLVPNPVPK